MMSAWTGVEQGEGKVICGVSCSPVSCVTALNASCGQESSHMLLAVYRFPISSVPLLQK